MNTIPQQHIPLFIHASIIYSSNIIEIKISLARESWADRKRNKQIRHNIIRDSHWHEKKHLKIKVSVTSAGRMEMVVEGIVVHTRPKWMKLGWDLLTVKVSAFYPDHFLTYHPFSEPLCTIWDSNTDVSLSSIFSHSICNVSHTVSSPGLLNTGEAPCGSY